MWPQRYSLTWSTQTCKAVPPSGPCEADTRVQGLWSGDWRLQFDAVQLQKDAWPGMPYFFFPILEAAVCVGNCRLVQTQSNGFSIKAKSKEGSLRECAVCFHIRAVSRWCREKKTVNEKTQMASRASHWLNSWMRTGMFVQGLLYKCFPELSLFWKCQLKYLLGLFNLCRLCHEDFWSFSNQRLSVLPLPPLAKHQGHQLWWPWHTRPEA